jgi:cysteine desulfurase
VIYADNAATTRISDSVFEKMLPFLREQYGNASSQYSLGVKAKRAVEHARRQVAVAIGANASEITFTSGGSEANSWVIRSVAETYRGKPMHIITSEIEHHSVLNACRALEQTDIEVTYLPVNATGVVEVTSLKEVIRPHTKLVSIMLANNEIGTVQPVEEIGQLLKSKGILFHTDAVQAVGHVPVNVSRLGVDFLTASAHKFNGAKGTGILYKRSGDRSIPLGVRR